MQQFIFLNVTGRISDRSVFIIPDACEHAVIGPRVSKLLESCKFLGPVVQKQRRHYLTFR